MSSANWFRDATFKSQPLHMPAISFILKDIARTHAEHFLPKVVLIHPKVHCKFLRAEVKRRSLCQREKTQEAPVFLCNAYSMTQQQKGHELERKLWEMLHVCVDVLCVSEHVLTKWPAKCIREGPFTLLLKQLCYYYSAVAAVYPAKYMTVHYGAVGCFSI